MLLGSQQTKLSQPNKKIGDNKETEEYLQRLTSISSSVIFFFSVCSAGFSDDIALVGDGA